MSAMAWLSMKSLEWQALKNGDDAVLEGIALRGLPDEPIRPGDLYVAERNAGPKLLTCHRVNNTGRWIVPLDYAYSYSFSECVRVEEADR